MSRRMLFVRLPNFATERFVKVERETTPVHRPYWDEPDDGGPAVASCAPLVLVDHGPKGTRISAAGPEAQALGLWPDMKLADARTMVPVMRVEQHDKAADAALQTRLAFWLTRWSPAVSLHEENGFLLDTTGCDHLFGGEEAMAGNVSAHLARLGFTSRIALCNSVGAAIALADHGTRRVHVLPLDHPADALDDLPVDALRLEASSVLLLKRLGLKRIGDVRRIPRAALDRRFRETAGTSKAKKRASVLTARSVQMRLDQLCGLMAEPLITMAPPQPFRARLQCPDPALDQAAVETSLDRLLDRLCGTLERAASGGRSFHLIAYRADGGTSAVGVRLSHPSRSKAMIARLFRDRLEQIECGFGIDLFALETGGVERLDDAQPAMSGAAAGGWMRNAQGGSPSLVAYADIVANRVGQGAVVRLAPCASHVPERAQRTVPVTETPDWNGYRVAVPVHAPRPLRLLTRPERADVTAELPDSPPAQFVWRKVLRRVIRSQGPERILPEWWHDSLKSKPSASFRDYYDVEDERGLRYWIFRAIHEASMTEPEPEEPASEPAFGWDHGGRLQNPVIETKSVREVETTRTISWFVHGLF